MPSRPPPAHAEGDGASAGEGAASRVRAQTNVLGYVLLLGMVLTSATLIVLSGASVVDQLEEVTGQESTTNAIEELDTALSSVASVGGLTRTEFSIGDASPSQYRIVNDGYVNVTVNRNASCRAQIPMSSIQYERQDGVIMAFEGGGVWRQEDGIVSQTAMHTPPDLTYENGTIALTVINVSGRIRGTSTVISENVTGSMTRTNAVESTLFTGYCARPDNVTISVTSDYFRGWSGYMSSRLDASRSDWFDSNRTARVYYDQEKLPEVTNDSRNDVVDLSDPSFNDVSLTNTSVEVDKDANNTYTAIVTPLSSGSTQVGEIRTVEADSAFRPPLDVVFVIDESTSMGSGSPTSKIFRAKDAAQSFVGMMDPAYDRAGAVGFNDTARYLHNRSATPRHHVYLSDDFDDVNGSIDTLTDGGYTASATGLRRAVAAHGLKSNSSRKRIIILLADGEDTAGGDPIEAAEIADKEGITIHTIGYGITGFGSDDANQTLQDIAATTGGTWRFTSGSQDLSDIFEDLFAEISETKQVVRSPFSMEMEVGGTTFQPQIDGNASHVADGTNGELNLNDPTAPSQFSYSIDVSDGQNVTMQAVDYDCDQWERTEQIYVNQTTGQEYAEVRCTEMSGRSEVTPKNSSVYVDGDDVSDLLDSPSNWWNEDLKNQTLAPYLDGPDNETVDLDSNQALVVYEFDDDDAATDRVLVLYRLGKAREDTVPKYVFNIQVRELVVEGES